VISNNILTNFFIGKNKETDQMEANINHKNLRSAFMIDSQKIISEIIENTQKFERLLNPKKKYFFSEKMNLINPTIAKNNSDKIIQFVTELVQNKEYLAIDSFYSKSKKFFEIGKKKQQEFTQKESNEELKLTQDKPVSDHKIQIEEIEMSDSKNEKSQENIPIEEENNSKSDKKSKNEEELNQQFEEAVNRSTTEVNFWKNYCKETKIKLENDIDCSNRSFFGYYNFHNFFNHFIILYERLKFMKSLTDRHSVFPFMKKVMMLNFTGVIDSVLFEDIVGCLLSEHSGVFLNLEKILSNVIKEIPSHEIDRFVIGINSELFNYIGMLNDKMETKRSNKMIGYPYTRNQEQWLFTKTCHKLSTLTFKGKANCKQSQIQSYINNNNLTNDHVLKFEFRTNEQVLVIHKVKSIYEPGQKQVKYVFKFELIS
jgi:hypothetical protein